MHGRNYESERRQLRVVRRGSGPRRGCGGPLRPEVGKDTRELIGKKTDENLGAINESSKDLIEKGRELYERGRHIAEEAAELFERGRELVRG